MSGWSLSSFIIVACCLLSQQAFSVDQNSSTLKQIEQRGTLNVCIWPEYFSITYQNPRTARLEGIDIELSQALANDLGVQLNYVTTHFGRFIKDLNAKQCDIAMFGVGNTASRRELVDFSEPYLSSGIYGIRVKNHPFLRSWSDMDQEGVIVCVQKGTYMENLMRQQLKHAQISTVIKPKERELEVLSGRADVFITDYPYSQKILSVYDWAELIEPKNQTRQFQYAYAVAKDDPLWLARVNQFVRDIKQDGRLIKAAKNNALSPIVILDDES